MNTIKNMSHFTVAGGAILHVSSKHEGRNPLPSTPTSRFFLSHFKIDRPGVFFLSPALAVVVADLNVGWIQQAIRDITQERTTAARRSSGE